MKCIDCSGVINFNIVISLQTGCSGISHSSSYPCDDCGRLHWRDSSGVYNRSGEKAFLIDGELVLKGSDVIEKNKLH